MAEETITLRPGQTAAVGYGSMLSRRTVAETIGRDYEGSFVRCVVKGWRRSWDSSMPNSAFYYLAAAGRVYPKRILYLNVRPDPETAMNCAVFVLDEDELAAMDGREWIYDRVVVTPDLRGVRIDGGEAIMYVCKQEHRVAEVAGPQQAAVRNSYLRMIDRVLDELDPAIRKAWDETTDPIPEHLVVDDALDRSRPNPWEAAGHDYRPDSQFGEEH